MEGNTCASSLQTCSQKSQIKMSSSPTPDSPRTPEKKQPEYFVHQPHPHRRERPCLRCTASSYAPGSTCYLCDNLRINNATCVDAFGCSQLDRCGRSIVVVVVGRFIPSALRRRLCTHVLTYLGRQHSLACRQWQSGDGDIALLPPELRIICCGQSFERLSSLQIHAVPALRQGLDVVLGGAPGTGKTTSWMLCLTEAPTQRTIVFVPRRHWAMSHQGYFAKAFGRQSVSSVIASNHDDVSNAGSELPLLYGSDHDMVFVTPEEFLDHARMASLDDQLATFTRVVVEGFLDDSLFEMRLLDSLRLLSSVQQLIVCCSGGLEPLTLGSTSPSGTVPPPGTVSPETTPLDQVSAVFKAVGKRYVEATRVVSMPVIPRSPFAHYSVNVAHFPSRIDTFLAVMDRCCPVPCKVIVYTSNARQAEWLAARLRQDVDVDVVVLHGGMDSGAREASLVTFRVSDVSERSLLLVCSGSDLGPGHDP